MTIFIDFPCYLLMPGGYTTHVVVTLSYLADYCIYTITNPTSQRSIELVFHVTHI